MDIASSFENRSFSLGRQAKLKLLFLRLVKALFPALAFGILTAVIVGHSSSSTSISYMLVNVYGTAVENLEDVGLLFALFFFAPPLLQLVMLGDIIPREAKEDVYALTRSKGRVGWYVKKLVKVLLLSILMNILMLLPVCVNLYLNGGQADEMAVKAISELMATWGLCMCAFVVFSNVIGLFIKPLYLLFITMFTYALGLMLMMTHHPAASFFPTVQGMLYAHNSIFGSLEEGFFTPAFSAGYLTVMIAALGLLDIIKIRRADVL